MCTQFIESEVIRIKPKFETVVRENTGWLSRFISCRVNKDIAEDLLQEVWIKAYRAYDDYVDDGRLKAWLLRITKNHLNNYFGKSRKLSCISLDAGVDDDEDELYTYLSAGMTPEEEYVERELVSEVLSVINSLPDVHRQVITYRFIYGFSIGETAVRMNIPQGTVKSKTHYAIDRIRKNLNYSPNSKKGACAMECNEIYKYLFVYSNGTLTGEAKSAVEEHIEKCEKCRRMVRALEKLIPTMTFAREDEFSHYIIEFPEFNVSYAGLMMSIDSPDTFNKKLQEWGGVIPDEVSWFESGHSNDCEMIGAFDVEGNEIEFVSFIDSEGRNREKPRKMKKVYANMWIHHAYKYGSKLCGITASKEAPNLYYGNLFNCLGQQAKSSLYQAFPANAENVRIKRGNGVIACDTYNFAYVDRYVAEEECITLEYSFNINN